MLDLLSSSKWDPKQLCQSWKPTDSGETTTPFRELIKYMPGNVNSFSNLRHLIRSQICVCVTVTGDKFSPFALAMPCPYQKIRKRAWSHLPMCGESAVFIWGI